MDEVSKMKVEIWSDIMCPFCYIGKRKFEQALQEFDKRGAVEVEWHSFQLDPSIQHMPGKDVHTYLAEIKGKSREWSLQVHKQLTDTAKAVGLAYNFDIAVIANSFEAHRLIQLAKRHGRGDAAEERLFKAYFTEGKNVSDHTTLLSLGEEIGLDRKEVAQMLTSGEFGDNVQADIEEARQLGVNGVPFFVFDRKYAVAGAQSPEVFAQVLEKSFDEWNEKQQLTLVEDAPGNVCEIGGECS
ncbi:MAG TPA: DsbA family oxidoreductase [Chitinophagaceae bacterium]|nr:DsbA family oxidoreductase [Chitinophagaceae bacterium]